MNGKEFLDALFSISPGREVVVRQVPPKHSVSCKIGDIRLPKLISSSNWWFGVCPRQVGKPLEPASAVCIWADIDGVDEIPPERLKLAPPSAIINSGHGFHLYWFLDSESHVQEAMRFVKLARLAFDADHQAVEPSRLLRIPGTMNVKSLPHVPCEVSKFTGKRYSIFDLEDQFLAAWLAPHWVEGQRNEMVQGLALISARAGWDKSKVEGIVKAVCKVTHDNEKVNRLKNVDLTYEKHSNGDAIGMSGFADIVGSREIKQLFDLIGYDVKDGDVRWKDIVIGSTATVIQDIVRLFTNDECRWAWSEGQVVEWKNKHWVGIEPKTLASEMFDVLDELVTIKGGHEKKRPCKPAEAEGIARIMTGKFAEKPLEEMAVNLLPLKNGVLDMATGEFRDAEMEDNVKISLPIEYDPEAECPAWEQFLDESATRVKDFLQEFVGYCLRPGNFFQRMAWPYGESGTGKSTFLTTVFSMFGKTAVTLSSQNISQYQIAMLADAKIAMCTELTTQRFRTATFKALVSGDSVLGRHPYGRPFPVVCKAKIMFGSNSLPTIDEAEGMVRRIAIVPFDTVPPNPDPTLATRLKEELPGILNWALVGLKRIDEYVIDRSWPLPECIVETVTRYRSLSNLIDMFMIEEVQFDRDNECTTREMFMRFSEFSRAMGQPTRELGAWFSEEFVRRGCRVEDGIKIYGANVRQIGQVWGMGK